jgi:large subunit ribosomal protein L24
MHIKVDDIVEVITGDDRGTQAKVLKIDRAAGKLVVEGVNRVYKHVKRSQRNPQGGRLSKEMPIQISNVLLVCPQTGKGSRTGTRVAADGTKELYFKSNGATARSLAPARKSGAAKSQVGKSKAKK